ncbi:hypothetical protein [uncultured Paracoccus sp.]|uniref:hypothetical protein n=1 Tax=uncultured Paracoccus sp. TaxID=189685 RepID=UPI00262C9F26|nr:hypothetical protein [uncultured Paracoccus sp.]
MPADFFEEVPVVLKLDSPRSAGELNRVLRELGATLDYDVYNFDRSEKHPIWQSESYALIDLAIGGQRADAQDGADQITVSYPMATIPSTYIARFVDLVLALAGRLGATVLYCGEPVDRGQMITELDKIVTSLMTEWGEEPGSESLAIMIEEQFARR